MLCTLKLSVSISVAFAATLAISGYTDTKTEKEHKMNPTDVEYTNHLINETSPYLLQHAHNPVDWYPWGDEAFERARSEDKPIFLSIGYAACHWCHVMEEESFEDSTTAAILNENFISIKVDREERPDLDQIYMAATQALTGGGGWPMSVFLTPDLKPFYAGTYFPPDDMAGRPGFKTVLNEINRVYTNERGRVSEIAEDITGRLNQYYGVKNEAVPLTGNIVETAAKSLLSSFDRVHGGFGRSPKFPHAAEISFLFKFGVEKQDKEVMHAALFSLKQMARGGIYDQIGGGFHRYSVDERWLVPHFEKMLYDNALLAVVYAEAYQITREDKYREIVRGILDFVLREMTDNNGGFYSSLDADSEGEEGKFYVWEKDEIDRILGKDSEPFNNYFNITAEGNFENRTNIPNITDRSDSYFEMNGLSEKEFSDKLNECREMLFRVRAKRPRPFTDDKIMTSWNGLMISGFAYGYQVTGNRRYRDAAIAAADFIIAKLSDDKILLHSYRDGKTTSGPFLEDYAYYIRGLIDLYEIEYDYDRIKLAEKLSQSALDLFADSDGHYYLSPADNSEHYMRPKDISDGALPSPGSIQLNNLIRLSEIAGRKDFLKEAEKGLNAVSSNIAGMPQALISAVAAYDNMISQKTELAVVGSEDRDAFVSKIYAKYLPHRVIVVSDDASEDSPLLKGRQSDGTTVAYVCRNFACNLPAGNLAELTRQLDEL